MLNSFGGEGGDPSLKAFRWVSCSGRKTARTALTCFLSSSRRGGSCWPASFCGQMLVMHFVEVLLSLIRSQAGFRLQATQSFAR